MINLSFAHKLVLSFFTLIIGVSVINSEKPINVEFELVKIDVGGKMIEVKLADNDPKRLRGLMGVENLNHGLILVYEKPWEIKLWMKDTPSALDVAFISEDWQIHQINQMQPYSLDVHKANTPSIAALEMPLNWFRDNNIRIGDKVKLLTN